MTKVTSNIGTQPLISNEKLEAKKRQIAMEQARFLQGDNPNLVGTVIGFTKRRGTYLTPNSPESKPIHDSFFIFFDHITGTVTRHLLNKEILATDGYRYTNVEKLPVINFKNTVLGEKEVNEQFTLFNAELAKANKFSTDELMQSLRGNIGKLEALYKLLKEYQKTHNKDLLKKFDPLALKSLRQQIGTYLEEKEVQTITADLYSRFESLVSKEVEQSKFYDLKSIRTGKLDSMFYKLFMELLVTTYLSQYLKSNQIQLLKNTNALVWQSLLDHCSTKSIGELYNKGSQEEFKLFSRKFLDYYDEEYGNYFYKYDQFYLPHYSEIKTPTIRIPKVFFCKKNIKHFQDLTSIYNANLNNCDFKLELSTMANAPEALKVVKGLINGNLLFTPEDLQKRIVHCNYIIKKKLVEINFKK